MAFSFILRYIITILWRSRSKYLSSNSRYSSLTDLHSLKRHYRACSLSLKSLKVLCKRCTPTISLMKWCRMTLALPETDSWPVPISKFIAYLTVLRLLSSLFGPIFSSLFLSKFYNLIANLCILRLLSLVWMHLPKLSLSWAIIQCLALKASHKRAYSSKRSLVSLSRRSLSTYILL